MSNLPTFVILFFGLLQYQNHAQKKKCWAPSESVGRIPHIHWLINRYPYPRYRLQWSPTNQLVRPPVKTHQLVVKYIFMYLWFMLRVKINYNFLPAPSKGCLMGFWNLDYTKGAVGTPLKNSYSGNQDFVQFQGPIKQIIRCYFHHDILNQQSESFHWIHGHAILLKINPISWEKNHARPHLLGLSAPRSWLRFVKVIHWIKHSLNGYPSFLGTNIRVIFHLLRWLLQLPNFVWEVKLGDRWWAGPRFLYVSTISLDLFTFWALGQVFIISQENTQIDACRSRVIWFTRGQSPFGTP